MIDTLIRTAVVYVFLMAVFRCLGKRELSSMSPFELVTLMLIPEIVSSALSAESSLVKALAGVSMLFLLVFGTSVLAHRFRWFERLTQAPPTVLVNNGRLCESVLNRERIQPDEIFAEMRRQGITDLAAVRWAILESEGDISIVPYQRAETKEPKSETTGLLARTFPRG